MTSEVLYTLCKPFALFSSFSRLILLLTVTTTGRASPSATSKYSGLPNVTEGSTCPSPHHPTHPERAKEGTGKGERKNTPRAKFSLCAHEDSGRRVFKAKPSHHIPAIFRARHFLRTVAASATLPFLTANPNASNRHVPPGSLNILSVSRAFWLVRSCCGDKRTERGN